MLHIRNKKSTIMLNSQFHYFTNFNLGNFYSEQPQNIILTYPEIGDSSSRCALSGGFSPVDHINVKMIADQPSISYK